MKLFQYNTANGMRIGFVKDGKMADLTLTVKEAGMEVPCDMEALIAGDNFEEILAAAAEAKPVSIDGKIDFAPVVTNPDKVICIGLNYQAHIDETGISRERSFPPVFPKYPNSLTGHGKTVKLPGGAYQFDYEAELVIVIGKEMYDADVEAAANGIFGYTCGNDFSARDLQFATGQWLLGKACDDFGPVGPYLVTADSIDADHLDITCKVNGELVQSSNTANMIFNCAEIVSYLSHYMTLKPGDLIFSGTPDGVILGRPEEERNWLVSGDVIDVTIEGIGTLTNTCK